MVSFQAPLSLEMGDGYLKCIFVPKMTYVGTGKMALWA